MAGDKKQRSLEGISDPDNYFSLNVATTMEEAEAKLSEFWDEFYELRKKHQIPDAYVIVRVPIKETGDIYTSFHCGCSLHAEPMTAWAFGREQSDRQARIADLTKRGAITRKSRP